MNKQATQRLKQHGFVLFIALIALVVMSLAAVALIRSVDTNTVIANNLSLKQSALVSSDRGVETALAWIDAQAILDTAILDTSSANDGYYATYLALNLDDPAVLKNDATWDSAISADAVGTDIAAGTETTSQNNIRYIIQRMCTNAVAPTNNPAQQCLFGDIEIGTSSKGVQDATGAGAIVDAKPSPMYRVTLRVNGPKNTTSYTQTYVY